jgi:DNA-binding GntR family transcriptional regulator
MPSSKRLIYDELRDQIITGLLRGGEQLSADDLGKRYGVSKTPIREALKRLEQEGLVEAIPRVGYFVSQVTLGQISEVFQLRRILEVAAAEIAAEKASEDELLFLESLDSGYARGDIDGFRRFLAKNREFHYRVALASGNKRLADSVRALLDEMQRFLFLRLHVSAGIDSGVRDHQQLVAALRARDATRARETMIQDIEAARQALVSAIMEGAGMNLRIGPLP